MSLAEFTEGYLATLRWSASGAAQQRLKREISREELFAVLDTIREELSTYWSKFGASIEAARGISGCNRSVSWQAGHDLCFARNGRPAFRAADWGDLATQLSSDAIRLGAVSVDSSTGSVEIKTEQRTRIG